LIFAVFVNLESCVLPVGGVKKCQRTCDGRGKMRRWSFFPCTRRRIDFRREWCDKSRCLNIVRTTSSKPRLRPVLLWQIHHRNNYPNTLTTLFVFLVFSYF